MQVRKHVSDWVDVDQYKLPTLPKFKVGQHVEMPHYNASYRGSRLFGSLPTSIEMIEADWYFTDGVESVEYKYYVSIYGWASERDLVVYETKERN